MKEKKIYNDTKESYCSFEVSKELKMVGFNVPLRTIYDGRGREDEAYYPTMTNTNPDLGACCVRPTISLACEWVFQNYGVWVWAELSEVGDWFEWIASYKSCNSVCKEYNMLHFDSPWEACDAGLMYVLVELVQKGVVQ